MDYDPAEYHGNTPECRQAMAARMAVETCQCCGEGGASVATWCVCCADHGQGFYWVCEGCASWVWGRITCPWHGDCCGY